MTSLPPWDLTETQRRQIREAHAEAAEREHLRHMTDGRWHDNCCYCLARREHGGTGLGVDDGRVGSPVP